MARTYKQLDQFTRDRIKALLDSEYNVRTIGRTLGFHHTTISRELTRNSNGIDRRTAPDKRGLYDPTYAQHKAYVRRKYASYQGKKIQENNDLRLYVIDKLKQHLSPDEIAGEMKKNKFLGFYASKTTIYEWLRSSWGQRYCEYLYSGRYDHKRRAKNKTKRVMIPGRIAITDRPMAVEDRLEVGHCEFDSVVSSKRSGSPYALAVVIERSSRIVRARIVPNLKPTNYAQAIVEMSTNIKAISYTTDNGIENRHHSLITKKTGATVFFTEPYSSWQKGSVENANKMLRRYFPKGTDFSTISQTEVDWAVTLINNKPRKILGYKSAIQVAKEKGVLAGSGALGG